MKRSFSQANITTEEDHEEEDYSQKLKLCKVVHPSFSSSITTPSKDEASSCNTIIILDDCISSELLHVKYSSESFIISYLSNFETLLSTHETNQLLNDQTLSTSLQRITNMYCTPPNQTDFSFLSNITEPGAILYWIKQMQHNRKDTLTKAYPFLSSNVKQDEDVILIFIEHCCDVIIDDLDFEKLDDSLIHKIRKQCLDLKRMCDKLTMDQILTLIMWCSKENEIINCIPIRIISDPQFWEKCKQYQRPLVFSINFKKLTSEIKNNKDLVLQCFGSYRFLYKKELYEDLSRELQNDVDICCAIVRNSSGTIPFWLNKRMQNNRKVQFQFMKSNPYKYEQLLKKYQQDQEFLLEIAKSYMEIFLKYNIHYNVEFVKQFIKNSHKQLIHYNFESIGNVRFNKIMLKLRNDKEFILHLMKSDPNAFNCASESIRNDPEVYNQVITENYYSKVYEYLPEHLKTIDLVFKYFSTMYHVKIIPPENIRNDKEIMMKLLPLGNGIYNYASNELKLDREFVMKALDIHWDLEIDLNYWKDDLTVLLKMDNINLEIISEELRSNFNIALAAVIKDRDNLNFLPKSLFHDINFIVKVLQHYEIKIIEYIPNTVLENKENVKIISKYWSSECIFKYVNSDFEFMTSLIHQINPLQYASHQLRNNKEFVRIVLSNYLGSLDYISDELKGDCEFILNLLKEFPTLFERNSLTNCEPKVIVKVVKEFPHLFQTINYSALYYWRNQEYCFEMSLWNFNAFEKYLVYFPKQSQKHQQLLREHLRLKLKEKYKNSNLAVKIWNHCYSLLKQSD